MKCSVARTGPKKSHSEIISLSALPAEWPVMIVLFIVLRAGRWSGGKHDMRRQRRAAAWVIGTGIWGRSLLQTQCRQRGCRRGRRRGCRGSERGRRCVHCGRGRAAHPPMREHESDVQISSSIARRTSSPSCVSKCAGTGPPSHNTTGEPRAPSAGSAGHRRRQGPAPTGRALSLLHKRRD